MMMTTELGGISQEWWLVGEEAIVAQRHPSQSVIRRIDMIQIQNNNMYMHVLKCYGPLIMLLQFLIGNSTRVTVIMYACNLHTTIKIQFK